MSIQPPHTAAGLSASAERRRRVEQVVEDAAVRRLRGEALPDEELLAAHPDLLPELREQLSFLRAVEQARVAAPQASAASRAIPASHESTIALTSADAGDAERDDADDDRPPTVPLPPDAVPGYRVLREISRGGQGAVYEAMQLGTKRSVAIKVLHAGAGASPAARRRFEREVELVAQLKHPNIISIFHSGTTPDGRDFYVMDLVEGRPLRDWVRERKPPLGELLRLFEAICDAVQYAHQRGVIHRDLKPGNILVVEGSGFTVQASGSEAVRLDRSPRTSSLNPEPRTLTPQPKILDFGLARSLVADEEEALTLTDQVLGTLPYMSPEQATGNSAELDTRTDVYALGVILYELLTGAYPYPVAGRVMEVLRHIAETKPTPPTTVWRRESGVVARSRSGAVSRVCPIDDEIQTIVLKALSKERERRYQSAGEMGRDVGRYLSGEAIEAKRDSPWYVLRKWAGRNTFATIMVLSAAGILVGATGISLFFVHRAERDLTARRERDVVIQQQAELYHQLDRNLQHWNLGWFLLEWHAGHDTQADKLRELLFLADSPQRKVMDFLLSPQQSFEELRVSLPESELGLAYFAFGERETHAGRRDAARDAYARGLELTRDGLLRDALLARLRE